MKFSLCLCFVVLCTFTLSALIVPVSNTPVLTDDNMISGLVRVDPDDKQPEELSTKCWLWQDGNDLLAYFECEIDEDFYPGPVGTKDNTSSADYVRIQLITMPTAYYAYYYAVYPSGNMMDAVRNSDLNVDSKWNSSFSTINVHDDKLWKVTMRIPLSELRFEQQLPYEWKIIVTRNHKKAECVYSHPFLTTEMNKDYFLKAQEITLTGPIKRSLDISFRPYLVKSYDLIQKTDSFDPDNLGMDIAFNPSQRTRVKLSLNPDFSDVPPDDATDNYNNKYPQWLMENRFFFTEDIDVFGVGMDAFATRKIVQPSLAYKITGNNQRLNWGVLGAFDKEIRSGTHIINPDDYYQALAINPVWRSLKISNTLLSRINKDYYNHVYCGGFSWRFLPDYRLGATTYLSTKKQPDVILTREGYLFGANLGATPRDWNADAYYTLCSKDLIMDMGYLNRNDFHKWGGSLGWDMPQKPNFIKYCGASAWAEMYEYHPDKSPTHERYFGANVYLNFRPKFSVNSTISRAVELDWADTPHDLYGANANLSLFMWDPLSLSLFFERQNSLIYELYQTHFMNRYDLSLWGNPSPKISYSVSATLKQYTYPKYNVIAGEDVVLDNKYIIANADADYTLNQNTRFSGGFSYDTNDSYGVYGSLGYFARLRYEFKPGYLVYAGFQSSQYQTIKSTYDKPLGAFYKDSATAYVKLALTL